MAILRDGDLCRRLREFKFDNADFTTKRTRKVNCHGLRLYTIQKNSDGHVFKVAYEIGILPYEQMTTTYSKDQLTSVDRVIIGAGAAGLMCGIESGKRGKSVILLDHAKKVGSKILISGGGRCNFTNTNASPTQFISSNPHFLKSALSRYTANDFVQWVKSHGIRFHEKKLGQLFCDHSAHEIVEMLLTETQIAKVNIWLNQTVQSIRKNEMFEIETSQGLLCAKTLVIATGGLSIPKLGATDFGYRIARQFGLRVIEPKPALDGFKLSGKDLEQYGGLQGVSLDTLTAVDSVAFRENILFTHVGLSGPAALQASLYWEPGMKLRINLFPDEFLESLVHWFSHKKKSEEQAHIKTLLAQRLPKRVAERLCILWLTSSQPICNVSNQVIQKLCHQLMNWEITPTRTVGFSKAEVTKGGVDTQELSSKTMEAKNVPGLYFIGEVVDVTGWLGGYNFQWAWSSGWVAGNAP